MGGLCYYLSCLTLCVCVCAGRGVRGTGALLPRGRALLLPLSTGDAVTRRRGPGPRRPLHHLHARLVCLLLEDMDRRVRIERQGRESFRGSGSQCVMPGIEGSDHSRGSLLRLVFYPNRQLVWFSPNATHSSFRILFL